MGEGDNEREGGMVGVTCVRVRDGESDIEIEMEGERQGGRRRGRERWRDGGCDVCVCV